MNEKMLVDTDDEISALLAPDTNSLSYLNPSEVPDLDSAEVGFSLEAKYLKFSTEGQTVRAIYNGMTQINKKENGVIEKMQAAVLQNKEGLFLNSTSNILDQLARIPSGTAIQIVYTGDEKTSNGYNVKKFDIRVLNVGKKGTPTPTPVTEKAEKKDYVTLFWTAIKELRLSEVEASQLLQEANGNFEKAYLSVSSPF